MGSGEGASSAHFKKPLLMLAIIITIRRGKGDEEESFIFYLPSGAKEDVFDYFFISFTANCEM